MDFVEALRRELRKEMNELADLAATGTPSDWAGYQRLVGRIEGLASAERFLIDLKEKIEEQE
jgi:hypothetical protein